MVNVYLQTTKPRLEFVNYGLQPLDMVYQL